MKKHRKISAEGKVYTVIMTICFVCAVLSLAVCVVLYCAPMYDLMVKVFRIPEQSGYGASVCRENYRVLLRYNRFFGPAVLDLPDFSMSSEGAYHFKEVRSILYFFQGLLPVSIIGLVIGLSGKKKDLGFVRYGIITVIIAAVITGGALLVDPMGFIVLMHRFLFTNTYWIFDPAKDPVIRILPVQVFITLAAAIVVLMVIQLAVWWFVYRKMSRK